MVIIDTVLQILKKAPSTYTREIMNWHVDVNVLSQPLQSTTDLLFFPESFN